MPHSIAQPLPFFKGNSRNFGKNGKKRKKADRSMKRRYHVMEEGESLYTISQRYGCNPRELMRLNGITDPTTLSLGRELNIPTTKSDGRKVP